MKPANKPHWYKPFAAWAGGYSGYQKLDEVPYDFIRNG